ESEEPTPTPPVSEEPTPTPPESEEPIRVTGDLTGDEVLNTADAVVLLKAAAGMTQLTPEQIRVADVNGDGSVNTGDAVTILQFAAGLITEL
ncbi:MAG: dockerin type I repeat-containing protein, partial [Clostridia bacterium]|nr:dockerin type I repeat-containing protein [Clostridia bacterium]